MRNVAYLLLGVLAACAAPEGQPQPAPPSGGPQQQAPAVAAGEEQAAVARGATRFGLDLYRQLARAERNIFFSPISISAAFGLAQAGARGETEAEIARVLHYPLPHDRLHPALGGMLRALPLDGEGRQLRVANALWVHRDYSLRPEYSGLLRAQYGAAPELVDFVRGRADAAARINRWAERNTNGRIRNLIQPDNIHDRTRLVLTNTVWMKADWLRQFSAADTRPRDFHPRGGAAVRIPFMHMSRGSFRHIDRAGYQAIELPYRGEELSMIVFLPKARDGLPAFERELSAERLEGAVAELRAAERKAVDLVLPKIRLETRYELGPVLQALGMRIAFTSQADFSGIGGARDLALDQAIHQTFLQVDEEGTEAAAATALTIQVVSAPPPPEVRFHADRPFFFLLRDNRTGAALFMGRIEELAGS